MLRLKINQGTWYDGDMMLKAHNLAQHKHIASVVVPIQGYSLQYHAFPLNIGREASNHIVLDDGTVSRRHAVITYENCQHFIRDLGSKAGIRVSDEGGHKKEGLDGKILLIPGDYISLGETIISVLEPKEVF